MKKQTFLFVIILLFNSFFLNAQKKDSFTIVYNNISSDESLKSDWGYSAWIEVGEEVFLFDTGTKPEILFYNLNKLNLDVSRVSTIIISHEHGDHTGGLKSVLGKVRRGTKVFLPNDFDPGLKEQFKSIDFKINSDYFKISENVWLTGTFVNNENGIIEQAVVIDTDNKIKLITGCAHPGIVGMCESVKNEFPDKKLELLTGGFHLMGDSKESVLQISKELDELGFQKLGPSHCTGERSIMVFSNDWGSDFIALNLGDTYTF